MNQHSGRKSTARPTPPAQPDARVSAHLLVSAVLRLGRALDDVFDLAVAGLEPRDRAFARLVAATVLRRLGQIDAILDPLIDRPPPPDVQDTLRLGAAQILFLGTPAHAAVATSVDLVKNVAGQKFAGLVNAVLRRVSERGTALVAAQNATQLNTPPWLWTRWVNAYGADRAAQLAMAHQNEAAVDLSFKTEQDATTWLAHLNGARLPTGSLRLTEPGRIDQLPGFAEGAWWVQDAAAALPARILLTALGDASEKDVIDLCAAPGGKTLQLAAAGCRVTALDSSPKRLQLVHDNLQRTQLSATVVKADALDWRPEILADAVLLDAPCSATGTIRRHPDLPYLKKPDDIARQAARQKSLLASAAAMLKPGGLLLYSVCSLERDEGEAVIDAALSDALGLSLVPITAPEDAKEFVSSRGDLRTWPYSWPDNGGLDGFYVALLRKT
jgi:16S rRNA (cytosine967-C5)-methyltransferase